MIKRVVLSMIGFPEFTVRYEALDSVLKQATLISNLGLSDTLAEFSREAAGVGFHQQRGRVLPNQLKLTLLR